MLIGYYQKNKERLQKRARRRRKKNRKRQYGCEDYKNFPEDEKTIIS